MTGKSLEYVSVTSSRHEDRRSRKSEICSSIMISFNTECPTDTTNNILSSTLGVTQVTSIFFATSSIVALMRPRETQRITWVVRKLLGKDRNKMRLTILSTSLTARPEAEEASSNEITLEWAGNCRVNYHVWDSSIYQNISTIGILKIFSSIETPFFGKKTLSVTTNFESQSNKSHHRGFAVNDSYVGK